MKNILFVIYMLGSLVMIGWTMKTAAIAEFTANEYKATYEIIRADSEALLRTKGNHFDSAYSCKLKR